MITLCSELQDYIDIVRSGTVAVCKEQLMLADMVERTFENENIRVDTELLARYMKLQQFFPFELLPWEKFCFTAHNCTFRADGFLRWPELHIFGGRGIGKNGYSSFEQFANSTPVNGVNEYDIFTVAASEDNAKQSFDELYSLFMKDPKYFKRYFKFGLEKIVNLKTNSKIYYGTSAPKSKDGGRQGEIIFDELHAYENNKLIETLEGGGGKKEKWRILKISSFGDVREGPMDETVKSDLEILSGEIDDNGIFPFICRLDSEELVHDEKNWTMSNPSLPYFPTVLEEYRREYNKYKRNPAQHLAFMTKRMGLPKGDNKSPVTSVENIMATNQPLPDLKGKKCIVGFDYARLNDFAAAGLLFKVDGKLVWIQHSWVCEKSENLKRVKAPLREWEEKGDLTFVDTVEIEPEIITEWVMRKINELGAKPEAGALDSFRYALMKAALKSSGFDADKGGKNNLKLVRPSDIIKLVPVIDSYFNNKNIIWGDVPIMRWYCNNTALKKEKRDEHSYVKQEPKSRKTDGFMAFIHACTLMEKLDNNNLNNAIDRMAVVEY